MDTDSTLEPEPPRRSRWGLILRIAVSLLMLAVLAWRVPDVSLHDLIPTWRSTTPLWLAGAAVAMIGAFAMSTLRWQRVVDALATPPPFRRLFSHFLAAQFVSNVLPTAFGGDVVRLARLGRDIDSMPRSFASVTIERLTGWLVLPAISAVALTAQPRLLHLGGATTTALTIDGVTLVALIVILAVASNRRFNAELDVVEGWRRFLAAIHLGVDALRRAPRDAGGVLLAGVGFQLIQCVAVWMAARAIGVDQVTLGVVLAFFPAAAIAQNLPVGIGGLGVREGAFVLFFGAVHASRGGAISLGLTVYLLTVATSSLGAPSFAVGAHPARRNPG